MKKSKKLIARAIQLLFSLLMVTFFVAPVGADTGNALLSQDKLASLPERTGSVRLQLSGGSEGTSKEGVEFVCIRVAEIMDGRYILDAAYEYLKIDLDSLRSSQEMEEAAQKFASANQDGTHKKTDTEGVVDFTGLDVGIYLLKAVNHTGYDDVTPFLVSIPSWDETKGEMLYDIIAEPKHSPKPKPEKVSKTAPQTNVNSPVIWCFGGVIVILVTLFVINKRHKKKE